MVALSKKAEVSMPAVVSVLQHLVSQNEGKLTLSSPKCPFSIPWKYESAELSVYMDRLREWIQCTDEAFVFAMCLVKKLETLDAIPCMNQRTVHRVFFTCLMLAVKFLEDETYRNADFAKVGCVNVQELNAMECTALNALGFNCCVSLEDLVECQQQLSTLRSSFKKVGLRGRRKSSSTDATTFCTFTSLIASIEASPASVPGLKTRFSLFANKRRPLTSLFGTHHKPSRYSESDLTDQVDRCEKMLVNQHPRARSLKMSRQDSV